MKLAKTVFSFIKMKNLPNENDSGPEVVFIHNIWSMIMKNIQSENGGLLAAVLVRTVINRRSEFNIISVPMDIVSAMHHISKYK
jgi:hypothetical protein